MEDTDSGSWLSRILDAGTRLGGQYLNRGNNRPAPAAKPAAKNYTPWIIGAAIGGAVLVAALIFTRGK